VSDGVSPSPLNQPLVTLLTRREMASLGQTNSVSAAVFVSQTEQSYSYTVYIGHRLNSRLQTLTCNQTATCSPGLPFNDLHPR